MEHIKILPFTATWWQGVTFSLVFIVSGFLTTKKIYQLDILNKISGFLGAGLIFEVILTHLYLIFFQNTWSLQDSLPLHLCRISVLVAGFALITQKQFLYEWSVYLGLPGGLHSILTPELTQGNSWWMMGDYYITHSMLLLTPVFLTFVVGKRPRNKAIMRVFIYVNILAALMFPINFILHSNYMYLASKPLVKNPFLVGEWPWYILGLELAGILHMLVMDVTFRVFPNYRKKKIAEPDV